MRQYIQIVILFLFIIIYCLGFFKLIVPVESFPFIVKAVTLVGPVFVLFGLIRKKYIAAKKK